MEILKKCRSVQGTYKYDDYRDGVGYAALRAEEARMEHEKKEESFPVVINTKEQTIRRLTEEEQKPGAAVLLSEDEQLTRQFVPPECDTRGSRARGVR
jgi:hypothetical protein